MQRQRLLLGFGAALAILAAIAATSYHVLAESQRAEAEERHTHDVIATLERLLSQLVEAETAQRGFLLTADSEVLRPYRRAVLSVYKSMERLRALTAEDPVQSARMDALGPRVGALLAALEETIEVRRQNGFEGARQVLATERSRRAMDDLREAITQLQDRERQELGEKDAARQASARRAILLIVVGNLASFLLLAGVFYALHRENAERRRAELEAERANAAKSEFLSRMSHELRTPLNAILGFAQLLEMDDLTPSQQENVAPILAGGHHLLELINEVLDISRIESGRIQLSPEAISVDTLLREALDLIHPLAADYGVAARGQYSPERFVRADHQRLKQVLLNLLANGVKYNRRGGTLTVTYADAAAGRLRICVTDTGAGISREMQERLFVPFDRLGAERQGIDGTGLGLVLSRRLVEAMGGSLGVESTVGQGSTFWIDLARVEAPAAEMLAPEPNAQVPGAEQAMTVLYVEDNLSNLRLIERALAGRRNVKLVPAMQGRLGLDLAREHDPDVILLDLHLPDIDGSEVLGRLQADPKTRPIPVIIISADATPGQIQRLRAAGARDYMTKPLNLAKLLRALEDIVAARPREPVAS
jgi:signal transduction histidine kinase/ActR/RegA family two-component response regulator